MQCEDLARLRFVAARAVFGMSLSFHIQFASLGVVVPFMHLAS
jgi:cytochrome bd-type quinol oxidase subunit 1